MSGDVIKDSNRGKHHSSRAKSGHKNAPVAVVQQIEENLKLVYQASLAEPVPDRFLQLLAQLREKEGST